MESGLTVDQRHTYHQNVFVAAVRTSDTDEGAAAQQQLEAIAFFASGANRSNGRRIGRTVRSAILGVKDAVPGRDYAMLVRGVDV
ncbi:hypothetical protein [Sulfitobacter sp. M368]|uniref:hypothetical protein n=1 Tax=Sulfitobacter sp. M368 TaxID=2867021 RepID=UPI0021A2C215|nr:hypothetical protein [Sulfitobacter sp. M368]UWR16021.1 hypothetical protein K3754_03720 [Sulfitobacter sp. M368]